MLLPGRPGTLATVVKSSWPSWQPISENLKRGDDAVTEAPDAPAFTVSAPPAPSALPSTAALDERYGRGRQRGIDRRLGWGVAIAALALGLVVLLWGGWQTTSTVEFRDLHYEVVDQRTVRLDFEVSAPPGTRVACALEALSGSYATVGWSILELPVTDQRTRRFSETLVTTYEGATGTLRSCWVVEG
jgi:hypothetical protein